MEVLNDFYRVAENPYEYSRELKKSGKRIIGYFCSYTPEEIISASGVHPIRLFGTGGDITLADSHLQPYCCSLVRGALEEALEGRLDFLDGTVFPHTCDSIQRLSDIWRLNTNFGFFADVVLPVKLNTESSREYFADILKKFRLDLERGLGVTITDDKLKTAITRYNNIRRSLKALYEMHSKEPGILSGRDLWAVTRASMIMERDDLLVKLSLLKEALKKGGRSGKSEGKKRLVLAGSVCDHPNVYTIIEDSGGVVVWDDLCTGSRYFEGTIEENGNPVESIAARYAERLVCPAKHLSNTARGDNIVRIVKKHDAGGVVFLLLKFCDPHDFDYPYMKEFLDRENIPSMLLEVEDSLPSEAQLKTRFETFIHML
ncbi:MAG: 2-hydroxyacyl-CoA dehydratase [Deltaproteobacteria bacterium]|nr:2-hydroxyacyl-CoA dehydratase [Deltaproteobacteria bacterium]MBN2844978.1 2-hydroxyacyl-CoA dehydratase [Deltaproteobacteria bacterium]